MVEDIDIPPFFMGLMNPTYGNSPFVAQYAHPISAAVTPAGGKPDGAVKKFSLPYPL